MKGREEANACGRIWKTIKRERKGGVRGMREESEKKSV